MTSVQVDVSSILGYSWQMIHSRAASAVLVVAGLLLSTIVRDVNEVCS